MSAISRTWVLAMVCAASTAASACVSPEAATSNAAVADSSVGSDFATTTDDDAAAPAPSHANAGERPSIFADAAGAADAPMVWEGGCTATVPSTEVCDGVDNDCNGKVDEADPGLADPTVGVTCFASPNGVCATAAHAGATVCIGAHVLCVGPNLLEQNAQQETCNGLDDDCDGVKDNSPIDANQRCGMNNVGACQYGTTQCTAAGTLACTGNIDPVPEVCDGLDNDCDGVVDGTGPTATPPSDSVGACGASVAPPAGATSPCHAGTKACVNGEVQCTGVGNPTGFDTCGVDANCDGVLENQPDFTSDVHNCGSCGNDCGNGAGAAIITCQNKQCVFQGCQTNHYDIPANHTCSYACTFASAQELCNGVDDNCDGQKDENIPSPSAVSVCGVSPSATSPECTTGVTVACKSGAWACTFATPGVCSPSCASTVEVCDTVDNNCNGLVNENVANYGLPCASDTGKPPPGDGVCRTNGTYVCNGANAVACSAVKDLTKAGPELCDGIDNDCDGIVDEPFSNKGSNATFFVKPTVTKVASALWIYTYEASRPSASNLTEGAGNGYFTSAPAGAQLEKTPSCSVAAKIPWFNVTGTEVDQTCAAMGGFTCSTAQWQTACQAKTASCFFGYAPNGSACTTSFVAGSKFCNLGVSFDFDPATSGVQNGLLPTASSSLQNCSADWTGVLGNAAGVNDHLFDITGNLREITSVTAGTYGILGGGFLETSELGAACTGPFESTDQTFEAADTGFRCCFSADPTQ